MSEHIGQYIIFGFGYPLIGPIIALSFNKVQYSVGSVW